MRQQLKEQERQADDERYIKNKTQDENEQMNKTNSLLQQQIDELSLQLIKVSECYSLFLYLFNHHSYDISLGPALMGWMQSRLLYMVIHVGEYIIYVSYNKQSPT